MNQFYGTAIDVKRSAFQFYALNDLRIHNVYSFTVNHSERSSTELMIESAKAKGNAVITAPRPYSIIHDPALISQVRASPLAIYPTSPG